MNMARTLNPLHAASVALCGCDPEEIAAVWALLDEMGCVVHNVQTVEELDRFLAEGDLGAIIVQACPSRQEFLRILERPNMPPVIPLLRHADKYMYPGLLRSGAFDCVPLPAQRNELKRVLSLAIENYRKQLALSA